MKRNNAQISLRPLALAAVLVLPMLAQANTSTGNTAALPDYGSAPTGFYQIVEHNGEVFAAFGGTLENYMTDPVIQPAGTVFGAVFVFDAKTLALKQEIPLQAIGGALALNPAKNQLIVGHTHNHAISTIDLKTRKANYHVLDTQLAGNDYRMRYVATDSAGDVFVSAFDWHVPFRHTVFKFDSNGQRMPDFKMPALDDFSIPLSVTRRFSTSGQEQVLFGNSTIRLANSKTGEIEYTATKPVGGDAAAQVNLYNYIDGPNGSLIATNAPGFMDGNQGDYNLYLFQKGNEDQAQKLFTAATALEAIYNPKAGQLYATSYGNQVLSVIALDDKMSLDGARFENIRFQDGIPSNITMRQSEAGTELFVTLRASVNQIAKVSIAPQVHGIDGIRKPGACSVSVWDLEKRGTQAPVPCEFVDIEQQFKDNLEGAKSFAAAVPGQLEEAEKALKTSHADLEQARKALAAKPADAELKTAHDVASFTVLMSDFMLEATRRTGRNAAHVVQGAQRFLAQWQKQQASTKSGD